MLELRIIKEKVVDASSDCISELENTFSKSPLFNVKVVETSNTVFSRALLKFNLLVGACVKLLSVFPHRKTERFSIMLGFNFVKLIPEFVKPGNKYLYIYDAWPRFHNQILRFSKIFNIKCIFFSSHEVSIRFKEFAKGSVDSVWIPEGINKEDYLQYQYEEKDIDVLEFGRKYNAYHRVIEPVLRDNNKVHLYEKVRGSIVFKTRHEFLTGLGKSKISICIPSNITHPERAEDISTMTLRYLQSMLSKCLVVGILPEEMKMLFDYNPIIEIDEDDYGQQILDILNNYERYFDLIDRNYNEVITNHLWDNRLIKIYEIMKK